MPPHTRWYDGHAVAFVLISAALVGLVQAGVGAVELGTGRPFPGWLGRPWAFTEAQRRALQGWPWPPHVMRLAGTGHMLMGAGQFCLWLFMGLTEQGMVALPPSLGVALFGLVAQAAGLVFILRARRAASGRFADNPTEPVVAQWDSSGWA